MIDMDKRQRAMLREMGVRIWQPMAQAVPPAAEAKAALAAPETAHVNAINSGAAHTRIHSPKPVLDAKKHSFETALKPPEPQNSAGTWRVGQAQSLYGQSNAATAHRAARWLVLLEAPASSLLGNFNAFEGDAGKLLDNMLRAAGLHTAGAALLAPLVRAGTGGANGENGENGDLPGALTELLASAKADVVLVMGRLAAQALLQSTEPLAKLRSQVHAVQGQKFVITIDPTYLLRNPLDKAKAWDDLCLAISVANVASAS